eukprot:gene5658-7814_t
MNSRLMREFEELEGLGNQIEVDLLEAVQDDSKDDEDLKPNDAGILTASDIYYEMEKRQLKTTGFPDTDRENLQKAFDEEFKVEIEEMRARKREKQRKAAQQLGLQRRRMLMEKTLQEEQDEISQNHQVGMMLNLIKENLVAASIRMEVNSISARSLAKAMWANDTVTCLDLSSNDLNDHAGSYLARILKRNTSLKKIELDNNNLGSKACSAFGESLMINTTLSYLSLDSNPLCSSDLNGIKLLAEALRSNKSLVSLNLWRTLIPSQGGSVLASGIENNNTILFCDIGHNDIDAKDVKRIIDKLDSNLTDFEKNERMKRANAVQENARLQSIQEIKDNEVKQEELQKWLAERREQRAEDKRLTEEQRIAKLIEDAEERKRIADKKREEDRKAAEEAAAKKAKKKDKKGKK